MDRPQSEGRICSVRDMRLLTAANFEARLRDPRCRHLYARNAQVVAIGGRRCGHHGSTSGRDENAVACRMDRAGRLWVAISVARSDVLAGVRGRTSKLTINLNLNIGSPCGPGSWPGCLVSGGAHWGGLLRSWARVMICWIRKQAQQPNVMVPARGRRPKAIAAETSDVRTP